MEHIYAQQTENHERRQAIACRRVSAGRGSAKKAEATPTPYQHRTNALLGNNIFHRLLANTLVVLMLTPLVADAQTLTVNDGTTANSGIPMYGLYFDDYTKSECIIPATSLTALIGQTITAMTFYVSSASSGEWDNTHQIVFLKEVAGTTLGGNYSGMNGATIVFDGQLPLPHTTGAYTINFNTPYTYNGGNLLIGVYNDDDGTYHGIQWYGVGNQTSGVSAYGYNGNNLNSASYTAQTFLPKVTFFFPCHPSFSSTTDYITNITLGSINNTSVFSTGGYGSYTNLSTNVLRGNTVNLSLTSSSGSGNHGAAVWIDFNDNGEFETSERVGTYPNSIGPSTTVQIPLTIPANATLGRHTLRVVYRYATAGTSIEPCVSAGFGEGEDYTVVITQPCTPSFSSTSDYITNITLGTINNSTGFSSGGYGDYTNLSTDLQPGGTATMSLSSSSGSGTHAAAVWIDFNDNGIFETGERVGTYDGIGASSTVNITLTIPANAPTGTHTMRVVYQFSVTAASINPCASASYGEGEDYTVNIISCTTRTANITNCPGTMISGQQLSLNGTVSAGGGTATWSSSNTSILSLSGNTVTAGTPGTATITYTRGANGGYCAVSTTCQITVNCATNNQTFAFNTTTGSVSEDATLNIAGYLTVPTGATVTSYTSANTSIATVTNAGVVTGVSTGTTTITATIAQWTYNGVTYCQRTTTNSFTVTVTGGFTCESPNTPKEVGTGTEQQYTYGPVNNFWNYGIRQIIYDREDGLCAGVITGIAFNAYNGPIDDKTKVTIYMGERPTSTFSSTNDWTPSSELTKVYSGSMRFNTAGWKWFGFSQPFVYSGEGSLVVAIIDSSGAYDGSNYYFLNTNLGNGIYKQLYLQNDNNNYDINNPPTGTQGTYRPNTRFCIHCCTERTGTAGFEFCKDAAMIDIGSSAAITMPVEGADGVSPTGTVSYSSDNTSVATVSNDGTVTGVANGSATITAVMAYDDPTGYCPVVAKYNVQVGPPAPCFEIGAGSATNYYPIPGFWGNQYDVYIYTPTAATELNNNLTITSIAYDISSTNATSTSQMTIWVKDVDPATALSGGTTFATYIAGASQVYNNTSYSAPNTGWQTLDFSTPFSHSGGRALLVAVRGYGCTTSGGCSRYCRYTSATNTHWYKRNDGTDQGQSVSGTLDEQRANIKLCYEATAFTPDVMPTVEVTNATQPTVCSGNAIENMGVTASDAVTFSPALNTLGLSYNTSTHVISGTPNFTGTQTVTVTVTSSDGCLKATKDITITVNQLNATIEFGD